MTNSPIVKATPDSIVLKNGQEIKTKTLIWTCGVQGNSFSASTGLLSEDTWLIEHILPGWCFCVYM